MLHYIGHIILQHFSFRVKSTQLPLMSLYIYITNIIPMTRCIQSLPFSIFRVIQKSKFLESRLRYFSKIHGIYMEVLTKYVITYNYFFHGKSQRQYIHTRQWSKSLYYNFNINLKLKSFININC